MGFGPCNTALSLLIYVDTKHNKSGLAIDLNAGVQVHRINFTAKVDNRPYISKFPDESTRDFAFWLPTKSDEKCVREFCIQGGNVSYFVEYC